MSKIEEVKTLIKMIYLWTGINHEIEANEEHDIIEVNEGDEYEINEREEERVNEEEDDDYDDTRMEMVNDENATEEIDQETNIGVEKLPIMRKVGRPRNMTKEVIQVKRYLQRQENERLDIEKGVRRSSRIKVKRAMKCSDERIPRNIKEARRSIE